MRRIHIGLDVQDLDASIRFYSQLFGQEPEVIKADYAKWMVEDPRVNFSITARGGAGQRSRCGSSWRRDLSADSCGGQSWSRRTAMLPPLWRGRASRLRAADP